MQDEIVHTRHFLKEFVSPVISKLGLQLQQDWYHLPNLVVVIYAPKQEGMYSSFSKLHNWIILRRFEWLLSSDAQPSCLIGLLYVAFVDDLLSRIQMTI